MSTIPPNIVGPIAQTPFQQHQVSRNLETERGQQSFAADMGNKIREKATDSVGEANNDTRVHSDAEGLGSQGRQLPEQPDEPLTPAAEPDEDLALGEDGRPHIDVEA